MSADSHPSTGSIKALKGACQQKAPWTNVRGAFLTVCLPSLFVCLLELMFFAAVRVFRKRDR